MEAGRERLDKLYRHRFEDSDRAAKDEVWRVLCEHFFSNYVNPSDTVLDVGAGYCEFINHIRAGRKIAVDANPELKAFAGPGVEAHERRAEQLDFLESGTVDVAFSSNFFEHLPDKATLTKVVSEVLRVLKPGGRLIVMGPNVKLLPGSYWDYFDHHLPLTEKSVEELLRMVGFDIEKSLSHFMPYTVKSRLPTWGWLVRAYLMVGAPAFKALGRQFLVIAKKP